jgi:hypothetical protein
MSQDEHMAGLKPPRKYNVLTEEIPNIDEIRLMFKMIGETIPMSLSNDDIIPKITTDSQGKKNFEGIWILEVDDLFVTINLFKGKTSCVDYMLFNSDTDLLIGDAGEALVILESTKTSDTASRNTSVYQRITKFTTFDTLYPNFKGKKVMFWCNSSWKEHLTPTANFGFRLMDTLDISMYTLKNGSLVNIKDVYELSPYTSCDEIITSKNSIPEKKGNCSIRLSRENNNIYLSLKLDKGNGKLSGVISHDPNVGFLSGVINAIEKISKNSLFNYVIKDHNIKQEFSINLINIEFDGCIIKKRPELPKNYFILERSMTEKLATILYDQVSSNKTIFSNHGGCALTYIKDMNNDTITVGQKMPRPDIVFRNDELKEIEIIEGKLEKELRKGIKQLSDAHLGKFIEKLKEMYPGYTIKKGLCITINDIDCINRYSNIEFPVKFALDNKGFFTHLS